MFGRLRMVYRYFRVRRLIKSAFAKCRKYKNYNAQIYYESNKSNKFYHLSSIIKEFVGDDCEIRMRKAIKEISCTFSNGSRILIKSAIENNIRGYKYHYCLIDKDIPHIKQDYIETHIIRSDLYARNYKDVKIKKRDFGVAKYIKIV